MRRSLIAIGLLLCLSGCAGLTTQWRLQLDMQYATPEDKPAPPKPGQPL